jgi:hypothetical protein
MGAQAYPIENIPNTIINGFMTLAGVPTSISLVPVRCKSVLVQAHLTNVSNILVGNFVTGITIELLTGLSISIAIDDVSKVWISGTPGDGVSWLAVI